MKLLIVAACSSHLSCASMPVCCHQTLSHAVEVALLPSDDVLKLTLGKLDFDSVGSVTPETLMLPDTLLNPFGKWPCFSWYQR